MPFQDLAVEKHVVGTLFYYMNIVGDPDQTVNVLIWELQFFVIEIDKLQPLHVVQGKGLLKCKKTN